MKSKTKQKCEQRFWFHCLFFQLLFICFFQIDSTILLHVRSSDSGDCTKIANTTCQLMTKFRMTKKQHKLHFRANILNGMTIQWWTQVEVMPNMFEHQTECWDSLLIHCCPGNAWAQCKCPKYLPGMKNAAFFLSNSNARLNQMLD